MFVRHALPGERVRAVVTDGHDASTFWRADAVEVLEAVAGPRRAAVPLGRTGPVRRLRLAARQRCRRSASSRPRSSASSCPGWPASRSTSMVEAVPGDADGLGWRTRVQYAVGDDGRAGLRRHRSHEVVPVDQCRIAHPLTSTPPGSPGGRGRASRAVEVAVSAAPGRDAWCCRTADGPGALTETVGEQAGRSGSPAAASGRCTPVPPRRCSARARRARAADRRDRAGPLRRRRACSPRRSPSASGRPGG